MTNEFIRQNSERFAKMFESALEDNNSKSDKQASTGYTGVYTAIFPNKTPREIELEARVKDLEERIMNHSNTVEEYCSRLANKEKECKELEEKLNAQFTEMEEKLTAEEMKNYEFKQRIKELDEIAIALNTRVTQQTEEKYNLNMDILKLQRKLKIALNSLNYIAILDNNYIVAKLDAQQALQKISEVDNVNKK